MPRAELSPLFCVRLAGLSFDRIDAIATPETAAIGRKLAEAIELLRPIEERLKQGALALGSPAKKIVRSIDQHVQAPPSDVLDVSDYNRATEHARGLRDEMLRALDRELVTARRELRAVASDTLLDYLVFGSPSAAARMRAAIEDLGSGQRLNSKQRGRERLCVMYIQRLAAKNETFSRFGPTDWGRVSDDVRGVSLDVHDGIASRFTTLETWAVRGLFDAIQADPEAVAEIAPRLNPIGWLIDKQYVRADTGAVTELDAAELALARGCDGATPARQLGDLELVKRLVEREVLSWKMESPAYEADRLGEAIRQIERWTGPARDRWLAVLRDLQARCDAFAASDDAKSRTQLMEHVTATIDELGRSRHDAQRRLYAATNPIVEECRKDTSFRIGKQDVAQLLDKLHPWIEVWRDTVNYCVWKVGARLRELHASAPRVRGIVPIPSFLRHCREQGVDVAGEGLVALSHAAFQDVVKAFREMLGERAHAAEVHLDATDCAFLRRKFEFPDELPYTFPSADLQIIAGTPEDVAAGNYQWVLGEFHSSHPITENVFFWCCPDVAEMRRTYERITGGLPACMLSEIGGGLAHTVHQLGAVMPETWTYIGPGRTKPEWRSVRPADADVFVDEASGDVRVRETSSQRLLGSIARSFRLPMGFHPFVFYQPPTTPRLLVGDVIVQRRGWEVARDQLDVRGSEPVDLMVAVQRLRAQLGLPRRVYVRPSDAVLGRGGGALRDKDVKPVFIDFDSYYFIDILFHWFDKYPQLEVTEMLPAPPNMMWPKGQGAFTFELRTLIMPGDHRH